MQALESPSTCVFGLFDGKKLVSQSILSLPKEDEERELAEFLPDHSNSELAIYKAVLVDSEYRGHGLMKRMLQIREDTAILNNRSIAITQIAADNPASWINALRHGMQITKVGFDPYDQAEVIYLQKKIGQSTTEQNAYAGSTYSMKLGSNIHMQVPLLFNKMQELSKRGMIGVSWDAQNNALIWQQTSSDKEQMNINSSRQTKCRLYS